MGDFIHKRRGKISNSDYQELKNISKVTATIDLSELVEKYGILRRAGGIGAGTIYVLIGSKLVQMHHIYLY